MKYGKNFYIFIILWVGFVNTRTYWNSYTGSCVFVVCYMKNKAKYWKYLVALKSFETEAHIMTLWQVGWSLLKHVRGMPTLYTLNRTVNFLFDWQAWWVPEDSTVHGRFENRELDCIEQQAIVIFCQWLEKLLL